MLAIGCREIVSCPVARAMAILKIPWRTLSACQRAFFSALSMLQVWGAP